MLWMNYLKLLKFKAYFQYLFLNYENYLREKLFLDRPFLLAIEILLKNVIFVLITSQTQQISAFITYFLQLGWILIRISKPDPNPGALNTALLQVIPSSFQEWNKNGMT